MIRDIFFRSLKNRFDWRGAAPERVWHCVKYVGRSLLMARQQARWLSFLYGSESMKQIAARDPRIHERPHHHYINRRLTRASRFDIIESHYRFLLKRWPIALLEDIYIRDGVSLGKLTLKDGSNVELCLRIPVGRSREGELALYLLRSDGQALASIIFTIANDGASTLIGCVQGASDGLGLDAVRQFTRQSHGLRPKNLLLSMLYAFCEVFDIRDLRGVGNHNHPFAGSRKIKADYDAFWKECQGVRLGNGFYQLPQREAVRDERLIESKSRSAFRKRETLRGEATDLIRRRFGTTCLRATALAA
ncbi:DUF535 family protein [Rhodanobacter sp. L36]|uniref:VirK/YbjX family protein n=1 Tax=Rhodanobacter sp. L36 TaxID=1747221 RepID=UPI00131D6863|nr:DUF535 family protein [Rhodanobacter sp. L36]